MLRFDNHRKIAGLFISINCCLTFLSGANSHCGLMETEGLCPVGRYKITDLGVPKLTTAQLSKLDAAYSLAPVINNFSQILYNFEEGAYFRDPQVGEYSLNIPGIKVLGYALNNQGQMIVSLKRPSANTEWMLWSKKTSPTKSTSVEKWHIASFDPENRVYFSAINDKGTAIGHKEENGLLKPLLWSATTSLHQLGQPADYDITGLPRAINMNGMIAGEFKEAQGSSPMIWKPSKGLEISRSYQNQLGSKGWLELSDMVIDQHGIVFGNYQLKHASAKDAEAEDIGRYFLYRWNPEKGEFKALGIRDMRITSINSANTMAGSFKGRAAIFHEGQQPIDLNNQLNNPESKWELLEATAINDSGHIVGFGHHQGELHLFLLEPTL